MNNTVPPVKLANQFTVPALAFALKFTEPAPQRELEVVVDIEGAGFIVILPKMVSAVHAAG